MGILLFIIGTIFGSFALVIGTRLPLKENVITGRSRCDNCHTPLKWYDLIPILSYLMLKGKCRYCQEKISSEHIFIEIASGILFLIGYLYFGLSIKLAIFLVLIIVALIIFVSDFKYMIILDSPIIIGSILIIILKYYEIGFKNTIMAILYGIILFFIMLLIKQIGDFIFKRESLGGGDIKLAFLIGLSLGYPNVGLRMGLIAIIFASFLALPYAVGVVYLKKKNELPYGPFLIASMIIIYAFFDKFSNVLVLFNLY